MNDLKNEAKSLIDEITGLVMAIIVQSPTRQIEISKEIVSKLSRLRQIQEQIPD